MIDVKKLLTILMSVFICLFVFASCAKSPQINLKLLPNATSNSISYGLYGMDGEIEEEEHFQIDSGSVFEKILSFGNFIKEERDYRLLIFANYKQIEFSVDSKAQNSYYDFVAQPNEHIQCTLTFPKMDDGLYDLVFIIVKDPFNVNLEEEYRKQTDLSHLITMRYSLQIGTKNVYEEPVVATYKNVENKSLSGVFLNDSSDELRRLLTMECPLFEEPELFVHLGNKSDSVKKYIVILLLDWQQLPMGGQDMLYVSVPPTSRAILPIRLNSLDETGVHNLTAICVEDPFQKESKNRCRADFSIRIGINVE